MTVVMVREDINTSSRSIDRDWIFGSTSSAATASCHIGIHYRRKLSMRLLTFKKRLDVYDEWGIQNWWSLLARHQQVTSKYLSGRLTNVLKMSFLCTHACPLSLSPLADSRWQSAAECRSAHTSTRSYFSSSKLLARHLYIQCCTTPQL